MYLVYKIEDCCNYAKIRRFHGILSTIFQLTLRVYKLFPFTLYTQIDDETVAKRLSHSAFEAFILKIVLSKQYWNRSKHHKDIV